ncbi:MAG: hypothetical protein JNJ45_06825 [Chthonomonas sp.]|nr:hypothetical protein [Chthonomonas sp.]
MTSLADVIEICEGLAGSEIDHLAEQFSVGVPVKGKVKGYAWTWLERFHPKKARIPNREVLAIRVANLEVKAAILAEAQPYWVDDDHYNSYPAVIVRLPLIKRSALAELLQAGYNCWVK